MPTKDECDYLSTAAGADSITIARESLEKKNPACRPNSLSVMNCVVYIAVYCASLECLYSLQASQNRNTPTRLIEGLPQYGIVEEGKPQFYAVMVDTSNATTEAVISIQPKSGHIKAYSLFTNNFECPANESLKFPGPDNHDTASFDRTNAQVLVVRREDSNKCCLLYTSDAADE
eukprot:TRINITY_DN20590_c0_g1_i2.p1 TRINITY_DN20590_c0_g1~~TRINITY_DN20590_c0_g1_i2.p1  ORF type:complete len:175 (-),score=14.87 TRINITY_DN20590_c0_g1_i2:57-581(-)